MALSITQKSGEHHMAPDTDIIEQTLIAIAMEYPPALVDGQRSDIPRVAFNIGLVLNRKDRRISLCDLGGGIGLFSVGCAALGMKSVLIDDFGDEVNDQFGDAIFEIHKSYGVEVIRADVTSGTLPLQPCSMDAVTCFDSMEHWHRSPKPLLASVMRILKPEGVFVLGVPNRANLRKRVSVPLGYGKWSSMEDWYEPLKFRGHVREPDVDDLGYIARDMGLVDWQIYGRNWMGYSSPRRLVRLATYICDGPLRLFPSMCGEIYLVGKKGRVQ
jgi:SAM-dependent methyltransferase